MKIKSFVCLFFCTFSILNAESGVLNAPSTRGNPNFNWNDPASWLLNPGTIPNAADDAAIIMAQIVEDVNISLAANVTIGSLNFDSNLPNIDITPSSRTLIFERIGNHPATVFFSRNPQSPSRNLINTDIKLNSNLNIYGDAFGALFLDGNITGDKELTFSSNKDTPSTPGLFLRGNNTHHLTTVNGALVTLQQGRRINTGPALSGNLTLNPGSEVIGIPKTSNVPFTLFSENSEVTIQGGKFIIRPLTNDVITKIKTLKLNNNGQIFEESLITTLSVKNEINFEIGGGTIALSQLHFFGGTISYKGLSTENELIGKAHIKNSNLNSSIIITTNNNPLIFDIDSKNREFDMLVTNGVFFSVKEIIKEGQGSLLFNGQGILQALVINNGSVWIGNNAQDQMQAAPNNTINISKKGFLGGLGSLGSNVNVTSLGSINPGIPSTIGTFTINGNVVFNDTAVLNIRALNTSVYDKLKVNNGSVAINHLTIIFTPQFQDENVEIFAGQRFDVIDNTMGSRISLVPIDLIYELPDFLMASIDTTTDPRKVTIVISDRHGEPTCGQIDPPSDLQAELMNKKCSQPKVHLTWQPSICDDILGYFIYRNGKQIGMVEQGDPTEFVDTIHRHKCYLYEVTAVNESEPIAVEVKD